MAKLLPIGSNFGIPREKRREAIAIIKQLQKLFESNKSIEELIKSMQNSSIEQLEKYLSPLANLQEDIFNIKCSVIKRRMCEEANTVQDFVSKKGQTKTIIITPEEGDVTDLKNKLESIQCDKAAKNIKKKIIISKLSVVQHRIKRKLMSC